MVMLSRKAFNQHFVQFFGWLEEMLVEHYNVNGLDINEMSNNRKIIQ